MPAKGCDHDTLFDDIRNDLQSWRVQAHRLRLSAAVLLPAWEDIRRQPQARGDVREKMLAYSEAWMLLNGIAFENLLKGILYGRDPEHSAAKDMGGHGIAAMATAAAPLNTSEKDLLGRLQRYLIWAGRYSLPTTAEKFRESFGKILIRSNDPSLIDALFTRFDGILDSEWKARQKTGSW